MFIQKNKELLTAAVAYFQSNLLQFSDGQKLVSRLKRNPQKAIRKAFKDGKEEDIDKLFGMLPRLNRYFRAAKLLNTFSQDLSHPKTFFRDNIQKSEYNIGKGAILISKLHYSDKQLKSRNVEQIFLDSLQSMALELKRDIQEVIAKEKESLYANQSLHQSFEEKKRSQIFAIIVALDRLIKKREQRRHRGLGYVHLVDQVLDPNGLDYYRATPIVYSTIYCTLVNSLNLELEAFGVSNPKHFLSRMSIKNTVNCNKDMKSPIAKLVEAKMPKSRGRITFSFVKDIIVMSVPGQWMRVNDPSFSSSVMKYDRNTSMLSVYADNHHNRCLWQVQIIENSRPSNYIKIGVDYIGEYFLEIDGTEKVVPCTVRFSTLSTDLISWCRSDQHSDQPYVEIEVCYKDTEGIENSEGSANVVDFIEYTERYCRLSDLDWCLLDFSEKGVTPITPVSYLEHLRR